MTTTHLYIADGITDPTLTDDERSALEQLAGLIADQAAHVVMTFRGDRFVGLRHLQSHVLLVREGNEAELETWALVLAHPQRNELIPLRQGIHNMRFEIATMTWLGVLMGVDLERIEHRQRIEASAIYVFNSIDTSKPH